MTIILLVFAAASVALCFAIATLNGSLKAYDGDEPKNARQIATVLIMAHGVVIMSAVALVYTSSTQFDAPVILAMCLFALVALLSILWLFFAYKTLHECRQQTADKLDATKP